MKYFILLLSLTVGCSSVYRTDLVAGDCFGRNFSQYGHLIIKKINKNEYLTLQYDVTTDKEGVVLYGFGSFYGIMSSTEKLKCPRFRSVSSSDLKLLKYYSLEKDALDAIYRNNKSNQGLQDNEQ